MGKRHDLPKIKPDEKPTIINHGAGVGGFWGLLAGIFASSAIFNRNVTTYEAIGKNQNKVFGVALLGLATGALAGGLLEKSSQEKEQIEGRAVKTPSYLNKGLVSGLTTSLAFNAVSLWLGRNGEPLLPKSLASVVAISSLVGGSIMRKNELQRDFDKAVAIRDANHAKTQQLLEAAIAQQQVPAAPTMDEPPSFKNSVTPDEAALLMEKQAQAAAPVVEKPAHGPEHKPHTDHAAHSDAHAPEHHAAHGEHHSEHQGEHHDAPSHAAKHEQQQHTGSHAAKHEPAASHTDHAEKHDAGMAMSA